MAQEQGRGDEATSEDTLHSHFVSQRIRPWKLSDGMAAPRDRQAQGASPTIS